MSSEDRKAKDEKIEELLVAYGNAMFSCGEYRIDDDDDEAISNYYINLMERASEAKAALLDAIEASVLKPYKTIDCDASYEKTSLLR